MPAYGSRETAAGAPVREQQAGMVLGDVVAGVYP